MKRRYVPVWFDPKKMKKILIALGCGTLVFCVVWIIEMTIGIPGVTQDGAFVIGLFFSGLLTTFLIMLAFFLADVWSTNNKYEIKDDRIVTQNLLGKTKEIKLAEIAQIYVVVHTSIPALRHPQGTVVRDVYDKRKAIYDVILLKEGCPESFLDVDMSYFIRKGAGKAYVLYDFHYDKESVLNLLKKTNATVHSNRKMYDVMKNDIAFQEYKKRIKRENLVRLKEDMMREKYEDRDMFK